MDPFSTYIFTDAKGYYYDELSGPGKLTSDASVLISFVAPSGQSLVLRVKHSGGRNGALEVELGPTMIQLNPSSKSETLLMIDHITLHPIQDPGTSESDHKGLSFDPGVRNDIFINLRLGSEASSSWRRYPSLHDIELLDESGFKKW